LDTGDAWEHLRLRSLQIFLAAPSASPVRETHQYFEALQPCLLRRQNWNSIMGGWDNNSMKVLTSKQKGFSTCTSFKEAYHGVDCAQNHKFFKHLEMF
jgi:hypothetical protein